MKRSTLISVILGTVLAVAPAAQASVMLDGGTGAARGIALHTDVLGGRGIPATAPAATSYPDGWMSAVVGGDGAARIAQAEVRADRIRGEALNARYGNAVTDLTPEQFRLLYEAGAGRLDAQQFAALIAHSQALNERYGVGGNRPTVTLRPDVLGGNGGLATDPTPAVGDGDSFASDAAYGAAALAGAMLLTLAFVMVGRRRHRFGV